VLMGERACSRSLFRVPSADIVEPSQRTPRSLRLVYRPISDYTLCEVYNGAAFGVQSESSFQLGGLWLINLKANS